MKVLFIVRIGVLPGSTTQVSAPCIEETNNGTLFGDESHLTCDTEMPVILLGDRGENSSNCQGFNQPS